MLFVQIDDSPVIGAALNSEKVLCESIFQVFRKTITSNEPSEYVQLCVQLQLSPVHSLCHYREHHYVIEPL